MPGERSLPPGPAGATHGASFPPGPAHGHGGHPGGAAHGHGHGHGRAAEAFDLQQYWHVLRKRRIAIGLTALLVVASAVVWMLLMRPMFRAVATIQIERENPNILSFQEILQVDSRQDDFYQTQYMLLQSRSLVRRVIEQGKLWEQPEFAEELAELPVEGGAQEGWDVRLVDLVQKRVHVMPVRRSRLVKIAADTHDPALSASVANGVAAAFIDSNLETKFETTEAATEFLTTQIESLKREVEEGKKRLQEYAEKSKILSLDEKQNITVQRLTDLNEAYTRAQSERIQAETSYRALLNAIGLRDIPSSQLGAASGPPDGLDLGRVPEVATNQLIQSLRSTQAQLQAKYAEMSLRFKPEWPEMVRLREQIADLGRQNRGEEWRIVAGMLRRAESDYRAALGQEQLLGQELEGQKQSVSEMNSSAILYNTLTSEIDTKSQLLDSLLKRKNETDVSARLKGLKSSNIRVVDQAEPPMRPFRPNKRVNTVLALLVGALLGVGVAFLLEYLDNTIKSVEEIERVTGLPSLGVIPLFAPAAAPRQLSGGAPAPAAASDGSQQLVTLTESRSAVSEAYRSLRTSILLSAAGSPPRFLLVTSSQPSEGKTTTVVNTAIALAQAGKKVLLIDADLRKPRCHRLLGLPNKAGLTTFLTGAGELKELIQPAAVKDLFVLTSGPIPPNPSELLGSARVKDLMAMIPSQVDHILFDSPPILTVTDATLLAALVDGVVLVVRAGRSPRELVRRSRRQLADVNAKIVGVVLNSVDAKHADYYYYSYAYSSYGYGDEAAG